jgi:putative transposase
MSVISSDAGLTGLGDGNGGRPEEPGSGRELTVRELVGDRALDLLLARSKDEAGQLRLTGEGSMLGELVRAVLERALEAEMAAHLGYEPHERTGHNSGNSRNGTIAKTVQTGVGPVPLAVPRDRAGSFEPLLVPKRAGRIAGGLDDMVISLYAHGMSVRDITHHLEQVYGTVLSAETVSRITEAVMEEVRAWQSRPLDPAYAVVFPGAIIVKVRDSQVVQNKPAYLAVGTGADGDKHVLGIWLAKTPPQAAAAGEGARFWGSVMNDLRNRGVRDILIACCDGLAGFEDAICAAFPAAVVQRCVVHLVRNALRPVAAATRPRSRPDCVRSTPRRQPRPPSMRWPPSPPRTGAASTRRPPGSSRTPGMPSPRSWPSARPSASCSTPPTRSSR